MPAERPEEAPGKATAPAEERPRPERVPRQAAAPDDDYPRQLRPIFHPEQEQPSEPQDAELVSRVRDGDETAYEELYRRHADAVRRYCRGCCRDAHTAEDLTGEVFARVLRALRGGRGPDVAVRAYLLTTVRRVAAAWARSSRRELLVEDFAVFASGAEGGAATGAGGGAGGVFGATPGVLAAAGPGTADTAGADLAAMRNADTSMVTRAFHSLPERWQVVLWHTAVEQEPPRRVAPLLGLTENATAALAHRAREGLRQAYLQAHVSESLRAHEECGRFADRLGAYARGGLRMRADRALRRHVDACARCAAAYAELTDVNGALRAVLPVALVGWAGASYAASTVGAGGSTGAAVASGGIAGSGGSGGAGPGGGAASDGASTPLKVSAGALLAAAAIGVAFALAGGEAEEKHTPGRAPPVRAAPEKPAPSKESSPPKPPASPGAAAKPPHRPRPTAHPSPSSRPGSSRPTHTVTPAPPPHSAAPGPSRSAPSAPPSSTPSPSTTPSPSSTPSPTPTPTASEPPRDYVLSRLPPDLLQHGDGPTVRTWRSGWLWRRAAAHIGGRAYRHGATVHAPSSVLIALNGPCSRFSARAGVDDLTHGLGKVRFRVYADGVPVFTSRPVHGGDQAVDVTVGLRGRETLRLVVEPQRAPGTPVNLASWADARFSCRSR